MTQEDVDRIVAVLEQIAGSLEEISAIMEGPPAPEVVFTNSSLVPTETVQHEHDPLSLYVDSVTIPSRNQNL